MLHLHKLEIGSRLLKVTLCEDMTPYSGYKYDGNALPTRTVSKDRITFTLGLDYKYLLLTMASDLPAVSQEHKTGNDSATGAQNEDISSSSPTAIPQTEPDESHDYASSTSKSSNSAENRLRPAAGIAFSKHFASALIDQTEYRRH